MTTSTLPNRMYSNHNLCAQKWQYRTNFYGFPEKFQRIDLRPFYGISNWATTISMVFFWFELFSIILDTLFGGLKSLILNGLIYILKLPFCCLTPFCVGFDQKCSWKRWDNVQKIKSYKFHRRKNLIWKTNLINFTIKIAAINKLFAFYCIDIRYSEKFIH